MLQTEMIRKSQPRDGEVREFPKVRPCDPAAAAVQAALAEGLYWLNVNHPAASAGDVEGVHHLRTTTRRLRTALELFRGLTDPAWSDHLADELKWLADTLGAVRDLDVMTHRLSEEASEDLGTELLGPLFDGLRHRHDEASDVLRSALVGDRYDGLVEALAGSVGAIQTGDEAWQPCREVLPGLVHDAWKRLKRPARALTPDDPDADFHEVRKRAKRARYAAEAVARSLDPRDAKDARRFAKRARDVQDVLGAHQDAVVAADEIRRAADDHPDLGPFNFAAGRLLERERAAAATTRARFFEVWDQLDRRKSTLWMRR
jgi:CHAD domain-containing protein